MTLEYVKNIFLPLSISSCKSWLDTIAKRRKRESARQTNSGYSVKPNSPRPVLSQTKPSQFASLSFPPKPKPLGLSGLVRRGHKRKLEVGKRARRAENNTTHSLPFPMWERGYREEGGKRTRVNIPTDSYGVMANELDVRTSLFIGLFDSEQTSNLLPSLLPWWNVQDQSSTVYLSICSLFPTCRKKWSSKQRWDMAQNWWMMEWGKSEPCSALFEAFILLLSCCFHPRFHACSQSPISLFPLCPSRTLYSMFLN